MFRISYSKIAIIVAMIAICIGISSYIPVHLVQMKEASSMAFGLLAPSPANMPGSSDPTGDEWPMFRGALNHTGVATTTPVPGTGPLWTFTTCNVVRSSPAVANGHIYIGSDNGKLYCLNATSGAPIWFYTTGNEEHSSPAVSGGRVFIGSDDYNVYCLNATTGARLWYYTTGNYVWSSPAVAGGRVYVGSEDSKVYCLNATTGMLVWSYTTGGAVYSSPAIASGRVYISSEDHKIYCLNATTGILVWSYTTGGAVYSSPAIAGGSVYVGSWNDKVYCLNATTGAFSWSYTTNEPIDESSPAIADGRLYVGSTDHKIYCLNATTGARLWLYWSGETVISSPAVAGERVYIGSQDRKLYCLNAITGELIWSYTTGGGVESSPAIANGRVYVGSWDGKLYCFPMNLPPSAPRNLQATGVADQVVLAWQIPQGNGGSPVTSYKIYRGTSVGGETLLATIGNVTTWTDTGVASGQIYYYKVSAISSAGEGALSNEASATPFNVPSTPRNLIASAGNGQVVLEWQSSASNGGAAITNYTIYSGTSPGGETNLTMIGNMTTWTDTGVANGQTYYYKTSATNAAGEGPLSGEAYATPLEGIISPSAPRNLQATCGNGQVALSWQAPANNGGSAIIFYKIYRGTTPGGELLVTTIVNVTTWTDSSLTNGQAYYYETSAINGAGEGPRSDETSATPATVPTASQSLSAMAGDGQAMLTWAAPASNGGSAITGYRIYQGMTPGGEILLTTVGNVTTYTSTGLMNGQLYYFNVAAMNAMGTGANSTETSATPATVPGAPRSVTATPGNTQVVLNWASPASNGGSPVTAYKVYQGTTPGDETMLTTIGNVTTCTSTGLSNGQCYYFTVAAVNAIGTSMNSTEKSATPATVPGLPRNLVISFGNGQAVLEWQAPSSNGGAAVTNYHVYRGTRTGKETLSATVGNVTMYVDTGLANKQVYYYKLSAINAAGEGNRTSEVRVSHHPPAARFGIASSNIYINTLIAFTDASLGGDSPVVAWSWSFGDNASATMQNVTHAYAEPGTYTITLIVRDENGLESNSTMAITVVAITSRQGLMNITAGLVIVLSAGVVTVVTLKKRPNHGNRI